MQLAWLLLQFALCASLIAVAGHALTRSADRIARATGLPGGWLGLALLATVTSLPELASGVASVTWVDAPNLAVGNALGACVFNLLFLAIADALQREPPLYLQAGADHLLSAAFGIVLLGLVALSLLLGERAPALRHVGAYSPLLLGLYLLALRTVHAHEAHQTLQAPNGTGGHADPREWRVVVPAALAVLAAGLWLPQVANGLAIELQWSRSFVGTLFMALATTLPEAAVTLSALRLRAVDLAVGNLLGSNLFNVVVLAVDDAVYTSGPLLRVAAPVHAATATVAIVMTALVMVGLLVRPRGRVLRLASWVSFGLVALYLLNAALHRLQGA